MRGPRIELWDPSDEGADLLAAVAEAFAVTAIEQDEIPLTRADLLIMAGDAHGSLPTLKILRDEANDGGLPVILLGGPPGARIRGDGPAFGADAVLRRPVAAEALLAKCHALLGDEEADAEEVSWVGLAPVEPTMNLSSDDPDSSQVMLVQKPEPSSVQAWIPREPTMQLDDDDSRGSEGDVHLVAPPLDDHDDDGAPSAEVSGVQPGRSTRGRTGSGSVPALATPAPVIPPERRAHLSPYLVGLFQQADRRAFPDSAPLAYHLPAAEEHPGALVPPELLERATALRLDEPVVEDPIDAFTYVGGPAIPPALYAGAPDPDTDAAGAAQPPSRAEATTATEEEQAAVRARVRATDPQEDHQAEVVTPPERGTWPEDDTVLGRPAEDGSRRGALGPGGALRLLFRLSRLKLDATLRLEADDDAPIRLTFVMGALTAMEGPIALIALTALRRRLLTHESASDETAAQEILARLVADGRITQFEHDRLVRRARETLLAGLVRAEHARFELRRVGATASPRAAGALLGGGLLGALIEAARDALDDARVDAMLGPEVGLGRGPHYDEVLSMLALPPELVALLERMRGARPLELVAAAPTERGLAGLLFALVAADALALVPAREEAARTVDRAAVTHLVRAASELALDADYFTIVGVARDAPDAAIEHAYRERRTELESLPLIALGLEELEPDRRRSLEALDEARSVLKDPTLLGAYRAALP